MSTIIYDSPVFGPVVSRRLGVSLGINLLPKGGKVCSFDCIYCECGLNRERRTHNPLPTADEVVDALERRLHEICSRALVPDVLTIAGNGEPTLHPAFPEELRLWLRLRLQEHLSLSPEQSRNVRLCRRLPL